MGNFNISTEKKLLIARWISRIIVKLRAFVRLPPVVQVSRSGVRWCLDLQEGIDLAIYLGVYEPETLKALKCLINQGDIVLDIGANIGAIALPLAQYVGNSGKVIAFEPTLWACNKLRKNAALNSHLLTRLKIEQIMLLENEKKAPEMVYSSWNLRVKEDKLTHPQHKGRLMETEGAKGMTLDKYLADNSIKKIDLIKLDIDGYELPVMQGSRKTLAHYRPKIILEIAPHVQEEQLQFESLLEELKLANYRLKELTSGKAIPLEKGALQKLCPPGGGINVIALPIN